MTEFEWRSGPDFAELAEALSINTDQILMATVDQRVWVVYTPDPNGKPPFWRAELERDSDGVFAVKGALRQLEWKGSLDELVEE